MSARARFLELMGANSPRPEARMTVENMDMLIRSGDGRMLALGMVALAEHLETAPHHQHAPTNEEIAIIGRRVCGWLRFESGIPVQQAIIAAAISDLDEYRAGKRGEG